MKRIVSAEVLPLFRDETMKLTRLTTEVFRLLQFVAGAMSLLVVIKGSFEKLSK